MATFYVGQRVRLARPNYAENAGLEGAITSFDSFPVGTNFADGISEYASNCTVLFDNGHEHACDTDQLEPIQPEGHKTVEWNACLWQPEHLREVA